MRIRFWGTRGSIASPGPQTVRYGGNTACVEVQTRAGTRLVLDSGTGIRALGVALMQQGEDARRGHILIGHTHWDHIQGFPFFAPLFDPANEWDVYAPRGFGASLQETLAGQMQYTYFPVNLDAMGARIHYHDLVEGGFAIQEARITTRYLNHPALTLGYRIEAGGVVVVYSSDHECGGAARASARLGKPLGDVLGRLHPDDQRHIAFVAGADLLIHDTQYTEADYEKHVGWGHSPMEAVVDLAIAAGVKRLALFHHDPGRDDAAVDAMVDAARKQVLAAGATVEVFAAAEGAVLDLRGQVTAPRPVADDALAEVPSGQAMEARPVLLASANANLMGRLRDAVEAEGLAIREALDAQGAIAMAHGEPLALAIVDQALCEGDGTALCHALRASSAARELPVIMLAATGANLDDPQAATASDWLALPVSTQYLRAKLRAWLFRTHVRWERAPVPRNEAARLHALRALELLDTPAEERFDRITRLAARMFNVPVALISLVDEDRQWFKSHTGTDARQTPRDQAFCAHAILSPQPLVVPDALTDERFADNPQVTGDARVRFYAGQRIQAADGSPIGTLCLVDHQPRQLDAGELATLRDLAALVERELVTGPG